MKYVGPVFHSDGLGAYLLLIGPRYVTVFENTNGNLIFGAAARVQNPADDANKRRRYPARYRLKIRLKDPKS